MSDPEPPDQAMPSHYEKPQLPGKPFVVGTICFFVFMALMFIVVEGLVSKWSGHAVSRREPPAPPTADIRWNAKAPQLEIHPSIDLAHLQQIENQRLHAIHWNDPAHSYATIPIETAMKMLADASAAGKTALILPPPKPATPLQLQVQKSSEANPAQVPTP